MKRSFYILFFLLLFVGCKPRAIAPSQTSEAATASPALTLAPSFASTPSREPATPAPSATPEPTPMPTTAPSPTAVPSATPKAIQNALFLEELLTQDGEPIRSDILRLLAADNITKKSFYASFDAVIQKVNALHDAVLALSNRSRTLTATRKEATVRSLTELMDSEILDALEDAYNKCSGQPGEGEEYLPVFTFAFSMTDLVNDIQDMEGRTVPYFGLDTAGAKDYLTVLSRYMGGPVTPRTVFDGLDILMETEAYAINTALEADPEASRKREPISFGSVEENAVFLDRVAQDLYALPQDLSVPMPQGSMDATDMDLLELAFRYCPGIAFLQEYATRNDWNAASVGYLMGLATHCSYAVIPYLEDFGLEYVQYRWYENMLDVTMTGMTALLIHYYGYSKSDLAAYLKGWGAEDFTNYLYDRAMDDPFESLVISYGYYLYLDICQAALDAGCESEARFLQDYLQVGPMSFGDLKEYMVSLYQNKVDKGLNGE